MYNMVNKVVATLKSMRRDSISEFKTQFNEASKKLHGDEFELTTPRLSARQVHRSNPPSSTPEEYYRICLYHEFLSHVLAELEDRFVDNPSFNVALGLLFLVPSECVRLGNDGTIPDDLAKAIDLFKSDLPHAVMLTTEYTSWVRE